jgi:hypothetical protein
VTLIKGYSFSKSLALELFVKTFLTSAFFFINKNVTLLLFYSLLQTFLTFLKGFTGYKQQFSYIWFLLSQRKHAPAS